MITEGIYTVSVSACRHIYKSVHAGTRLNINGPTVILVYAGHTNHTIQTSTHIPHAHPPSRGSNTDARGRATVCPGAFFSPFSLWILLSPPLSFILSLRFRSYATYAFLKSVHGASGDGGGLKPRPRFPSLAWLSQTQQLQRSPASSLLSKISNEDPQPLQGEAGTNSHVCSFTHHHASFA